MEMWHRTLPIVFRARDFPRNLLGVERSRFVQIKNKIKMKTQQSRFLMETETSTESLLFLVHIVPKSEVPDSLIVVVGIPQFRRTIDSTIERVTFENSVCCGSEQHVGCFLVLRKLLLLVRFVFECGYCLFSLLY